MPHSTTESARRLDREFAGLASDTTTRERHDVFAHVARIAGGTRFRDARLRLVQVDPSTSTERVRQALMEATWTDEGDAARSLMLSVRARFGGGVLVLLDVVCAETPLRMAA